MAKPEKYIRRELGLRISAIVSMQLLIHIARIIVQILHNMHDQYILYFYIYLQILAALCIIAAAICIDAKQKRDLHGLPNPLQHNLPWLVLDAYRHIDVRAANGWLIFVSIVLIIFQATAIVELFVDDIKVLKIKIPFGGSLWYLVTIIVSHHSNRAGLQSPGGG